MLKNKSSPSLQVMSFSVLLNEALPVSFQATLPPGSSWYTECPGRTCCSSLQWTVSLCLPLEYCNSQSHCKYSAECWYLKAIPPPLWRIESSCLTKGVTVPENHESRSQDTLVVCQLNPAEQGTL